MGLMSKRFKTIHLADFKISYNACLMNLVPHCQRSDYETRLAYTPDLGVHRSICRIPEHQAQNGHSRQRSSSDVHGWRHCS